MPAYLNQLERSRAELESFKHNLEREVIVAFNDVKNNLQQRANDFKSWTNYVTDHKDLNVLLEQHQTIIYLQLIVDQVKNLQRAYELISTYDASIKTVDERIRLGDFEIAGPESSPDDNVGSAQNSRMSSPSRSPPYFPQTPLSGRSNGSPQVARQLQF